MNRRLPDGMSLTTTRPGRIALAVVLLTIVAQAHRMLGVRLSG